MYILCINICCLIFLYWNLGSPSLYTVNLNRKISIVCGVEHGGYAAVAAPFTRSWCVHIKPWEGKWKENQIWLPAFKRIQRPLRFLLLLPPILLLAFFSFPSFLTLLTLIPSLFTPLTTSLPPPSPLPHQKREQMLGLHCWPPSLFFFFNLPNRGSSCSAMTGLNYSFWVCSRIASPASSLFLYGGVLCLRVRSRD